MLSLINLEFGIKITLLSIVTKSSIKYSNLFNCADYSSLSIICPTLTCLKIISITPAATFASEPCKAKPIANPAAPKRAINEVVSIPNCPTAAIITNK